MVLRCCSHGVTVDDVMVLRCCSHGVTVVDVMVLQCYGFMVLFSWCCEN